MQAHELHFDVLIYSYHFIHNSLKNIVKFKSTIITLFYYFKPFIVPKRNFRKFIIKNIIFRVEPKKIKKLFFFFWPKKKKNWKNKKNIKNQKFQSIRNGKFKKKKK